MDKDKFRIAFFLLLLVFISALFFAMIRRFLMTILLAAIFAGLSRPLYGKLLGWFRGRRVLAAATTLVFVLVVVIGPLLFFVGVLAGQAVQVTQIAGPWIQEQIRNPDLLYQRLEALPGFERIEPYRAEILEKLGALVGTIGNFVVDGLSATTKGTVTFFFHFFILLYTMFYFLMDGDKLLRRILYYIPLSHEDEEYMVEKFLSVSRATLKGTLIIGILQGGLAGVALALVGTKGPIFWGTVMMVLSIIPGIGTALVWGPVAIYKLATGQVLAGVFLLIFCGLLVGSIDNILRPRLVGRDVKMHDLLILFSTLGGIMLFGVVGFIIGPILAAVFVAMWDIYGVLFKDVLPEVRPFGERNN